MVDFSKKIRWPSWLISLRIIRIPVIDSNDKILCFEYVFLPYLEKKFSVLFSVYIGSRIAYDYLKIIVSTLQIEFHLYIATDYLETLVSIESGYLE